MCNVCTTHTAQTPSWTRRNVPTCANTSAHNNVPAICPDDNLALLGHSCGRCSRVSTSDRSRGGVTHFCVFFLSDPDDVSLSLTTTTPPPHTQHTHTHTCTRLYSTFTLAIHPQEGLATVLAPHQQHSTPCGSQLYLSDEHSNNVELAKRGKRMLGFITGIHCNTLGGSCGSRWNWAVRATAEGCVGCSTHCVCE
jgi:hypothetical protein